MSHAAEPPQTSYLDKAEPAVYKAMADWSKEIKAAAQAAGVSEQLLELVNLRVSQINGCGFCLDVHHAKALRLGEDARRLAVLSSWHETALFDARERASLELAEAVTRLPRNGLREIAEDQAREVLGEQAYAVVAWAALAMNAFNRLSIVSHHPVE